MQVQLVLNSPLNDDMRFTLNNGILYQLGRKLSIKRGSPKYVYLVNLKRLSKENDFFLPRDSFDNPVPDTSITNNRIRYALTNVPYAPQK